MKKATLAFIIKDGKILLGEKRGGSEIGDGTLNGPGGKLDPGETLEQCAVRETQEEVGITLNEDSLEKVAVVTFYAAGEPSFEVHCYRASEFTGEPQATESMVPGWYPIDNLPTDRMLESDRDWFPQLVAGEKFNANVYYEQKAEGYIKTEFLPFTS